MSDPASVECLRLLDGLGDGKGGTREKVWIADGGLLWK